MPKYPINMSICDGTINLFCGNYFHNTKVIVKAGVNGCLVIYRFLAHCQEILKCQMWGNLILINYLQSNRQIVLQAQFCSITIQQVLFLHFINPSFLFLFLNQNAIKFVEDFRIKTLCLPEKGIKYYFKVRENPIQCGYTGKNDNFFHY